MCARRSQPPARSPSRPGPQAESKKAGAGKGDKARVTEKCRQYNERGSCHWGTGCNRAHKCSECNGDHPAHSCTKAAASGADGQ